MLTLVGLPIALVLRLTLHSARHTIVSYAADRGVLGAELRELGHWKDENTAISYAQRTFSTPKRVIRETIQEIMDGRVRIGEHDRDFAALQQHVGVLAADIDASELHSLRGAVSALFGGADGAVCRGVDVASLPGETSVVSAPAPAQQAASPVLLPTAGRGQAKPAPKRRGRPLGPASAKATSKRAAAPY